MVAHSSLIAPLHTVCCAPTLPSNPPFLCALTTHHCTAVAYLRPLCTQHFFATCSESVDESITHLYYTTTSTSLVVECWDILTNVSPNHLCGEDAEGAVV